MYWIIGMEKEWRYGEGRLALKTEAYAKTYRNLISSTRSSYGRITYSGCNDAKGYARGIDAARKPYREEIHLWPILPMLGIRAGF